MSVLFSKLPTELKISRFFLMFLVSVAIIVLRRWAQFEHPGVWIEDGNVVLPSFLADGWWGLFSPVQGYLVVACKLVSFVALKISFQHYALISTILATLAQASCVGAVACAPTIFPNRNAFALAVVLLPTGSEAFGLPVYTLWWTTLLIFIALFWKAEGPQWARLVGLIIGGLSSPIIILLTPVFILRSIFEQRRSHFVTALCAITLSGVQGFVVTSAHTHQASPFAALSQMTVLISKYFGTALYGLELHGAGMLGCFMLFMLIAGAFLVPRSDRLGYVLLGLCLGAAVFSSVARVSVTAPHPLLAGPRYFFYPVTCILWMLIWIATRTKPRPAFAAVGLIGTFLPLLARALPYTDQIPAPAWSQQVEACAQADTYTFQLQSAGWQAVFRGEDCRALMHRSLFD